MANVGAVWVLIVLGLLQFMALAKANEPVWVAGFREVESMLGPRAGAAATQVGDYIYVIGGVDGRQFLASVEYARINADGSLSPWRLTSALPAPRGFMSAVAHDGAIYVAGGGAGDHGGTLYRSVLRSSVQKDGSLGPWEALSEMQLPRRCVKLFVSGQKIFAVGGFGGTLFDSVESAPLLANGKTGEWSLLPSLLTRPRYVSETRIVGDFAVTLGGHDPAGGSGLASAEVARLEGDSLVWRESFPMQQGRYAFGSFAAEQNLYVLGGISGTEYLSSIETTTLTHAGELTAWKSLAIVLPSPVAEFATLIREKRLFVLGGTTRAGYRRGVWAAEIDRDRGVGFWGQPEDVLTRATPTPEVTELSNEGIVRLTLDAGGYTYVLVSGARGESWLAIPSLKLGVNTRIKYGQGVFMSNFFSKALQRRFVGITFLSSVKTVD